MNPSPVTFVSFCVDIDRGLLPFENGVHRDFVLYKSGMMDNLNTSVPLVLYTSVTELPNLNHRNENNTVVEFFDKSSIEKEFPNFESYKKYYPITRRDEIESSLFYYAPLVVLKMKKIIDVMNSNPFNSEYFFWMDCFFTRGILETDFLHHQQSYLDMYENVKNKLGDKFALLNWGPRPFGFFWGGNKAALEKVYEKYFEIFFEFLPTQLMAEELIFKTILQRYPELMHVVQVEHPSKYKITCQDFLIK